MDNPFIFEIPDSLSKSFCKLVIDEYEKSDKKVQGHVGTPPRFDIEIKKSLDLYINEIKEIPIFKFIDEFLFENLSKGITQYKKHLKENLKNIPSDVWDIYIKDTYDIGYQIQMTDPGGFFAWHSDFSLNNNNPRVITFIWYLNTLEPEQGGCTEFIDGTKIRPEVGKLLLFPATWTGIHRGCVLKSGKKYIITGWLHSKG
jgi:hypothetical protein